MEDVKIERTIQRRILNGRGTEKALVRAAPGVATRLAARTPVRTTNRNRQPPPGETRASTRIETGYRNATGDRLAVRIVQDGASVPLNLNVRYRQFRYAAEALRG